MTDDEPALISRQALQGRFRAMAAAQVLLVMALVFGFWLMQQIIGRVDTEQHIRATQTCESAVTARATQLILTDVLIAASVGNGKPTALEQRRIDTFRSGVEDRLLSALPSTCQGIMTLDEFHEQVRIEALPPPDPDELP